MNVGLCCWNRWGDDVIDRPDNSDEPIVSNITNYLVNEGHTVLGLQILDDASPTFSGDDASHRESAFRSMTHTLELPDIDVLFLRWRWNITGRENLKSRQDVVLMRYLGTDTRVIVFDDDFQLLHAPDEKETLEHLAGFDNVEFCEISAAAKDEPMLCGRKLTAVPYPLDIDVDAALGRVCTPSRYDRLAYVGNRYERDDCIDAWLGHETEKHPRLTHCYGNWAKTDSSTRWPNIEFHPKVDRIGRDQAYRRACAVPMLAKQVYLERGHVVPRLHEVVHAGGIPIGLSSFKDARRYFNLVAEDGQSLSEMVDDITNWSLDDRRRELARQCDMMRSEFNTELFMERLGL